MTVHIGKIMCIKKRRLIEIEFATSGLVIWFTIKWLIIYAGLLNHAGGFLESPTLHLFRSVHTWIGLLYIALVILSFCLKSLRGWSTCVLCTLHFLLVLYAIGFIAGVIFPAFSKRIQEFEHSTWGHSTEKHKY